jgi:hypothetical protein
MAKLDQKKEHKALYDASRRPVLMDVPPLDFLMVDGEGDPNTSDAYHQALDALYGMSYTLKFMIKKEGTDYGVPPLEGLWWSDDMSSFLEDRRDRWKWTSMIMQPPVVTARHLGLAKEELRMKKDPSALPLMRWERYDEGRSAQVMHVGPYSEEGPTIRALHEFIADQGYRPRGKHHEIYLGDPRRAAPEKLRTIIRQPVGPQ